MSAPWQPGKLRMARKIFRAIVNTLISVATIWFVANVVAETVKARKARQKKRRENCLHEEIY